MDDDGPAFEIYQDPPDQQQPSANEHFQNIQPPTRPVLAEIRLPTWGTEVQCNSALKHEMFLSQPEAPPPPQPDILLAASLEESKENVATRPVDAQQSFKTPPRKLLSPGLNRTMPTYTITTASAPSIVPLRI